MVRYSFRRRNLCEKNIKMIESIDLDIIKSWKVNYGEVFNNSMPNSTVIELIKLATIVGCSLIEN